MSKKIITAVVIGLIVLGVIYYSQARSTAEESVLGESTGTTQNIKLSATDYAFTPDTITVNQGQPVSIELVNNGQYPHDFVSNDLNLQSATIPPGQSTKVDFTPKSPGVYTMYCSVDGHQDLGMTGTIVVQ